MDIEKAEQMAKELIKEHCPEYRFRFNKCHRACGLCKPSKKLIELSIDYAKLNDEEEVRDTILHEIAHALIPGAKSHGWKWKEKAKELGCSANRCRDSDTINMPKGRFKYICPNCGKEIGFFRRPKVRKACRECCTKYNGGRFSERFVFTEV